MAKTDDYEGPHEVEILMAELTAFREFGGIMTVVGSKIGWRATATSKTGKVLTIGGWTIELLQALEIAMSGETASWLENQRARARRS